MVFLFVYVLPCAIQGIWQLAALGPGEEAESHWLWGPFAMGSWFEKKKQGVDTFTCTAKASQDGTTVTKSCVGSHFDPIKAAAAGEVLGSAPRIHYRSIVGEIRWFRPTKAPISEAENLFSAWKAKETESSWRSSR